MNLAAKDIRRQKARFGLTALGLGLLFTIVLGMGGIYRGLVDDATLLVSLMQADFWLVQHDTRGPFAERSVVPAELADRARAVPGVAAARGFVMHTLQRSHQGKPLRLTVVGLDWPQDRGDQLPLIAGHALEEAHRQMIVDQSQHLPLGEQVRLGDDTYTVVGITKGVFASGGDSVAFVSQRDAMAIQTYETPDGQRIAREGRAQRLARSDLSSVTLDDRVRDDRGFLPVLSPPPISAVLVTLKPGTDPATVRATLERWTDVTVYDTAEQHDLLLKGVVEKARMQIGLFRVLLSIVSAIIVALIIYTMTMAKSREIALLKLMGAKTRVVAGLILQQALMLCGLGYAIALVLGHNLFPHFPRRVIVTAAEILSVGALVLVIGIVSSIAGIRQALRIPPTSILAG
jgi:putative ABC transport system permease protein